MNNKQKKVYLTVLLILVLLIALHYTKLSASIENQIARIFSPVQQFFYHSASNLRLLSHSAEIKQENERLKSELVRLSIDYLKLSSLEKENQALRLELDYLNLKQYQFRLANIIGRLETDDQILLVDQGQRDGLAVGQAATINQGVIVGKVIKVEDNISQILLLSDVNTKLAVKVAGNENTSGLLKGQTGKSLLMDLIPLNQEIKEDDLVVTSGLEIEIPADLVVGRVKQVNNSIGLIFKQAVIEPLVNYQNLNYLTIVLN